MLVKIQKILFISALLIMPFISLAQWDDCTHGKTDSSCEYPGECGRYTDTNQDNICDHSQSQPVTTKAKTSQNIENKKVATENTKDNNSFAAEDELDNMNRSNSNIGSDNEFKNGGTIENNLNQVKDTLQKKHKKQYPFLNIVIILSIFYAVTYLLAKRKTIKTLTHKKIWNILLTISFLVLTVTSVLLILQINSGKIFSLEFNILYWHVITGIIMMVITLFHMGWHWRYYKNLVK